MKDTEEKQFFFAQLRQIGPTVVPPQKSWIEKKLQFCSAFTTY